MEVRPAAGAGGRAGSRRRVRAHRSPPPEHSRRQGALTGAFVLLLLLAATVAALTPVAATSLVQYVRGRIGSERVYRPTSGATSPSTSMTLLHTQILRLGLVLQTLPAAGRPGEAVTVPPAEASQRLTLTLQEVVPQVDLTAFRPLQTTGASVEPTRPRSAGEPEYLVVVALALERPVYLKVLVVLVVLLVAAGAVYATWVQPMTDLMTKASTLVLGIWGIRSLLLGQLPPHATTIDALLTLIIFLVLGAIALRALYHLHDRTGLRVLPGARGPKAIPPPPRRPPGVRPDRRHSAGDRTGRRAGARAGVIAP